MNHNTLEYIIAIAEEKSLSRAAERLYITQSALSQQLQKLKKQGLPPLFYSEKRKLHLTDAGKIYLNGAREILRIEAEARTKLKTASSVSPPSFHIAIEPCLEHYFYTTILPRLQSHFSNISIHFSLANPQNVRSSLNNHSIDMVCIPDIYHQTAPYHYHRLLRGELVLVYPKALSFESLPITLPSEGSFFRELCLSALSENQLQTQIYAESNDFSAMQSMVAQGLCSAILPKQSILDGADFSVKNLSTPCFFHLLAMTQKQSLTALHAEFLEQLSFCFQSSIR